MGSDELSAAEPEGQAENGFLAAKKAYAPLARTAEGLDEARKVYQSGGPRRQQRNSVN